MVLILLISMLKERIQNFDQIFIFSYFNFFRKKITTYPLFVGAIQYQFYFIFKSTKNQDFGFLGYFLSPSRFSSPVPWRFEMARAYSGKIMLFQFLTLGFVSLSVCKAKTGWL